MKVAVLSDIHGNLPALQTVIADIDAWSPDLVVVAGDIVNRGPRSGACLDLLVQRQERDGWHMLRGNHEDFVLACTDPARARPGPGYETTRFAHFALAQVAGHAGLLSGLPDIFERAAPNGDLLRIVHASMRNNRDGIYPLTTDEELARQIAPAPSVFVTGHTHRPLTRTLNGALVVNIGSVGASFDGDRRAAYGRFRWKGRWSAEVVRLPYDYTQIERDYTDSGFLEEGGPLAQIMLAELRKAHGLIFRWASRYQDAVMTEQMSLAESVRLVLCDDDVRPFTGPPGWTF